jgi:NDP-sugar pyrophosphorylase family protein
MGLDTLSAGEALRAINDIGCIKHDFVLIQGDVISNMSIAKALSAHK